MTTTTRTTNFKIWNQINVFKIIDWFLYYIDEEEDWKRLIVVDGDSNRTNG